MQRKRHQNANQVRTIKRLIKAKANDKINQVTTRISIRERC